MVNHCANPGCAKPLHYLRDGRIFVFDVSVGEADRSGKRARRLEHYWLCGACSQTLALEQAAEGVRVIPRARRDMREYSQRPSAMAS